jgi:hypothetical protein
MRLNTWLWSVGRLVNLQEVLNHATLQRYLGRKGLARRAGAWAAPSLTLIA